MAKFDQPSFTKPFDRLSNGRPADPKLLGQLTFCGQLVPRLELAVQGRLFNLLNDLLVEPRNLDWLIHIALPLEFAYVGDHGRNLLGIRDINQPPVGAGYGPGCMAPPANPACEAAAVPFLSKFPFPSNINFLSNQDESNYHSLQATATQRLSHGLSFVASYTYSHALDEASNNSFAFQPQDSTHPHLEYGNSDFDIRHHFTLSATYALPAIKSFAQLLQGWNITSIVTLQGGQPWYAADFGDDISGTGELNDRWDFFGDPTDFSSGPHPIPFFPGTSNPACVAKASTAGLLTSLQSLGCYAQGNSVMIPPAFGTFGTLGRNVFRASGLP